MKTYCVRLWILGMVMCVFASCSDDTPTADPYADWEARNVAYIDSIADVVANPPAGETWYRYANYKIQNDGMGTDLTLTNSDYVYVKDLTEADAELGETPFATDTVAVHYRGWLINGEVFDQSYSGDWNAEVHVPVSFAASEVRTGWTTALLHMQEGEHWEVYIPYQMGYGTSGNGTIRGYSTLIFDIRLEEVIHPKGPETGAGKQFLWQRKIRYPLTNNPWYNITALHDKRTNIGDKAGYKALSPMLFLYYMRYRVSQRKKLKDSVYLW